FIFCFFFSSRRQHTRSKRDWSSDVCSSDLQFKFDLVKGDIIVFRSIRMVETNGEIVPNNWGATGNYRYSLNVLHEEYMATEDKKIGRASCRERVKRQAEVEVLRGDSQKDT